MHHKHQNHVRKGRRHMIFVFGSNLSGIHGAGAARAAHKNFGAEWGVGEGHTGFAYALPTKGLNISFMPLSEVKEHVDTFLRYARENPTLKFQVTCVGCGLAGFEHKQIAPMFLGSTENCFFDTLWKPYLGDDFKYWGTF